MIRYRPFEMHCHTKHSDGSFLVSELLHDAAAYGYEGIALTDHNVVTGLLEITPEMKKETVRVIPGIEWTTFFGHMLVLGCDRFVDWRFVTPDTIDDALQEIKSVNGVAGVAHPWEIGEPLMCGCHWEFRVTRWDLMSYVEIWSGDDPHARTKNDLALPWYNDLLNKGHHLAITAGRDWHGRDKEGASPVLTATFLGFDGEVDEENALNAIRAGRTFVTLGPILRLEGTQFDKPFGIGDVIAPRQMRLNVALDEMPDKKFATINDARVQTVRVTANGETLTEMPWKEGGVTIETDAPAGWFRVELHGTYRGDREGLLTMSSPIYATHE